MSKNGTSALLQNFAGMTRSMTALGGGLVREYVDVTNAATVGGIEIGVVYNCAINTATGVWSGRDIADICWLEKWHDVAGTKEFWFAPTGAANAVPVWTKIFAIDMVNGTVTLPTPAQFDNSTKAASTAFIQRALGNMSGIAIYAVSTALSTNDVGKWIAPTAVGLTLTLPLASTVSIGSRLEFYGNSLGCTIARSGTDILVMGGTSPTSIVLAAQDRVSFVCVGTGWYALGGEAAMAYSSSFSSSLTASGYQKLPSGMIIQWGQVTATITPTTYSFPIAFPTGCQGISCGSNAAASNIAIAPISTSQYSVTAQSGTPGGRWIAIGF